jgi:5-methylthioadenosine/S-adenosylhomocysteine deaminase
VVSNNQCDLIDEARFGGLLQRALERNAALFPSPELLRLMTIEGARALAMEDEIGSIEVGKQADLVAVDLDTPHSTPHPDPIDALMFSSRASDVCLTIVAGRILYDRQEHFDVDRSIIERVRELTL